MAARYIVGEDFQRRENTTLVSIFVLNRFRLKVKAMQGCRREKLLEYMDEFMWRYECMSVV